MYTECSIGTKEMIEAYVTEVAHHLDFVAENDVGLSAEQKQLFFANSRQAFGRTALMLSGGGSLGA